LLITPSETELRVLAKRALVLCRGKIIKAWNELVQEETRAFLKGAPLPTILYGDSEQREFQSVLERFAFGELPNAAKIAVFRQQQLVDRKRVKQWQSALHEQHKLHLLEAAQELEFDQFWKQLWVPELPKYIKKLLEMDNIEGDLDLAAAKLASNLGSLPCLEAFLKTPAALGYSEGKKRKPKRGDRDDIRLMACTARLDTFVSDEPGLKNIFYWVFPQKQFLSLQEFVDEFFQEPVQHSS